MLWCIGIEDLQGFLVTQHKYYMSKCTFYSEDGKSNTNRYEFSIFDDNDFSVEYVDCDYIVKCVGLNLYIEGIKIKEGLNKYSVEYTVEVVAPLFKNDIKQVYYCDLSKSTGYFNENFCRYFNMNTSCRFLNANEHYYFINENNSLSRLSSYEFNDVVHSFKVYRITTDTSSFILDNFKSGRTRVLNSDILPYKYGFSVIDLLDNYWYNKGIIGFSFDVNGSTIEVNTPTSVYKFELSDRLKFWVLKRRLNKQGVFFDDSKRRIKHSSP